MKRDDVPARFLRKATFQERLDDHTCRCLTCEQRCKIAEGKAGICGTRCNFGNDLYTIMYGCAASLSCNPIEKKPLYHFFPGSTAITIGAYGCNFKCFWCQNHDISHPGEAIPALLEHAEYISPEQIVKMAIDKSCKGTSISFNEPTLSLEYAVELFPLARKAGLYNTFVTNGYMTGPGLELLVHSGLDAMSITIKGDAKTSKTYCGADVEVVWRNAIMARKLGVHVEIVMLVIEGVNSDPATIDEIVARMVHDPGKETPLHLTRFFPAYKAMERGFDRPTPVPLLVGARERALQAGLKHVYVGNVPGSKYQHTTCPACSKVVIGRDGFSVREMYVDDAGHCGFCGHPICAMKIIAKSGK